MFDQFWSVYPRKVAKAHARKMWDRLSTEQQQRALAAIETHVAYWKSIDTDKQFIPHPGSWLNGERFEDEIEMPQPKVIVPNWWASESGIMTKAQEMGMSVRPGESWFELKNRINEAIKNTA